MAQLIADILIQDRRTLQGTAPTVFTRNADPLWRVPTRSYALLGALQTTSQDGRVAPAPIYISTDDPFCLVAVGLQGSGKSHTVATAVEGCILSCDSVAIQNHPNATVISHYDSNVHSICELATIVRANPLVGRHTGTR